MSAKNDLFKLIKTLDAGEIKHFRRQARQNPNRGPNNYLRLFEALRQEDHYDEAKIKQQFKGEGLEKHYANVKRYLYQELLAFLERREAENDPRAGIERQLLQGDVLWKKGLYPQSSKCFRKAAKSAREAEFFELEIRALSRLQRAANAGNDKSTLQTLENFEGDIRAALQKWTEFYELSMQGNRLFALSRRYFDLRNPQVLEEAEALMQHPALQQEPDQVGSFTGKRLFLSCLGSYANLQGNRIEYARIRRRMVAAWEENPGMIQLFTRQYRLDLANLLGADGANMDFSNFPAALARLHDLPASSRDDEGEVFQNVAFFELLYLLNSGQFESARDRLPAIEKGLRQFSDKISQARQLAFRYNMMVLYFILEDYSDALRILNTILHDERTEHRIDIQQAARLFLLIFHFELGNYDLLEYLFRSAHRYFYTRGSLGRFERVVLDFMRKTANLPAGPAMHPEFRKVLTELRAISEDNSIRTPIGVDEIIFWLRATLEQKPMLELAREEP